MAKLRIVLADDHKMMRERIKSLINSQADMAVAGEAADGRTALQEVLQLQPDLLILDISMPELNGVQVVEQMKQAGLHVRVLVLTVFGEAAYVRQLLEAGADGYLLKQAAAESLIGAIRIVAAGGNYLDPTVASKAVAMVEHQEVRQPPTSDELTALDRDVLRHLARGYTNQEIASRLNISLDTLVSYKARLMARFSHSRAQLVRFVVAQGWL